MSSGRVRCPGCRAELEVLGLDPPERYRASGECWFRYGELSAYNFGRAEATFLTQLAVDAYGAQHAGAPSRHLTTAFSLVGLYLATQRGYTGREVQLAHMQLARQMAHERWVWPSFQVGEPRATFTVLDVLAAQPRDVRDAKIRAWAAAVWPTVWKFCLARTTPVGCRLLPRKPGLNVFLSSSRSPTLGP
jgi:Family of unknown function (DUF5946)